MRVIFMGTPDFSVGTLEALIEAGHDVCLAVTQPDKPKGRGKEMQFPPVKESALRYGIPVFQPKKIRDPGCVEELKKYNADVMVVVAFGQILPKTILEMTPYGCINVHASLLPKYRGAAPIQWSIIEGETVTGVTTMQMDEGLDTGDMIMKTEVPIAEDETGESLHDKRRDAEGAGGKDCHIRETGRESDGLREDAYKRTGKYQLERTGSAYRAACSGLKFLAKRIYPLERQSDEDLAGKGRNRCRYTSCCESGHRSSRRKHGNGCENGVCASGDCGLCGKR